MYLLQRPGSGLGSVEREVRKRRLAGFESAIIRSMRRENLYRELCYRALETRDTRFDGRFFVAVLTTGIFCRPTCPARTPKRQNCTFYRSAKAARAAGFRPCLRCRPDFNAAARRAGAKSKSKRELGRDRERPESPGIKLRLPFTPPFDWPAMLDYLRARAIAGVEEVENDLYRRSFAIDGAVGVLEVRPVGEKELGAVIDTDDAGSIGAIAPRLRRVFDLDADPGPIGRHLSRDPRLRPLVAARPGLRVPGAWEPYELAVRAVLGQQVSVRHAVSLATRMVERHGEMLPARLRRRHAGLSRLFPRCSVLARSDLASLGMPGARARSIASLAAEAARDPDLLSPRTSLDESLRRLKSLPGIGEWTAHYIALRALREPDAFPAADAGLLRAMRRRGRRPTPSELLSTSQAWRPWRAYAAQHLWTKG
jgi:AraC family transcriptional regulator of adaptative response / DNA-3-methyladenine glycosylase II